MVATDTSMGWPSKQRKRSGATWPLTYLGYFSTCQSRLPAVGIVSSLPNSHANTTPTCVPCDTKKTPPKTERDDLTAFVICRNADTGIVGKPSMSVFGPDVYWLTDCIHPNPFGFTNLFIQFFERYLDGQLGLTPKSTPSRGDMRDL
jgi:hypothetical protein